MNRHILTGGHRHRSGKEAGDSRDENATVYLIKDNFHERRRERRNPHAKRFVSRGPATGAAGGKPDSGSRLYRKLGPYPANAHPYIVASRHVY